MPDDLGDGWVRHQVALEYEPDHPAVPPARPADGSDPRSAVSGSRPGSDRLGEWAELPVEADALLAIREAVAGFEMTQHLVSLGVADDGASLAGWRRRLRTIIERMGGETG